MTEKVTVIFIFKKKNLITGGKMDRSRNMDSKRHPESPSLVASGNQKRVKLNHKVILKA